MEYYEFEQEVNTLVKSGNIDHAIAITETKMKIFGETEFHKVIDRNFLNLKSSINEFLTAVYDSSQKNLNNETKAIYCEMNGFAINYEEWFVTGVTFSFCSDLEDTDWLADYEYYHENALLITGFEDLQKAYEDLMINQKYDDEKLSEASEYCGLLIVLRLFEAFKATYKEYLGKSKWTETPVFVQSHDSEIIYKTI